MNKLKKTIEQYGRWAELSIYIGRQKTEIKIVNLRLNLTDKIEWRNP